MNKLGICNFKIILIENNACASKNELLKRERYCIEIHDKNILLNLNRPSDTTRAKLLSIVVA